MNTERPHSAEDAQAFRGFHRARRRRRGAITAVVLSAVVLTSGGIAGAVSVVLQSEPSAEAAGAPAGPAALSHDNLVASVAAGRSAASSAHFRLLMSVGGQSLMDGEGDVSLGPTAQEIAMTMTVSVALPNVPTATAVFVDDLYYVNLGESTQDAFLAVDPATSIDPLAGQLSIARTAADPGSLITGIGDAVDFFDRDGEPIVLDGIETTPYLILTPNPAASAGAAAADGTIDAGIPAQIAYRFWVGTDGLIRRLTLDIGELHSEFAFERWGQPVTITPPPPDRITTSTTLG